MRGHIVKRRSRYYAVVYEGTYPATGKGRHRWYPGGETRREGARQGNLRRRLATPHGHDWLEFSVVETPGPPVGNFLASQDGPETILREGGGDVAFHRAVVTVDSEAERDDRRSGLHDARHAA